MPKEKTQQQLAAAQARMDKLRERARKEEDRKKIIVGAIILKRAESDSNFRQGLLNQLEQSVNERDRPLFAELGLPQLDDSAPETETEPQTKMEVTQQE